jgi:hypothetical protein
MKKIEAFFLGILAALFALVVESIIEILFIPLEVNLKGVGPYQVSYLSIALILAFVLVEEISKLALIQKKIRTMLAEKDILIGSLMLGLGFSFVEISLIAYKFGSSFFDNYLVQSILVAAIHIITAGIMGYLVSKKPKEKLIPLGTLLYASSIHFAFNLLVLFSF